MREREATRYSVGVTVSVYLYGYYHHYQNDVVRVINLNVSIYKLIFKDLERLIFKLFWAHFKRANRNILG